MINRSALAGKHGKKRKRALRSSARKTHRSAILASRISGRGGKRVRSAAKRKRVAAGKRRRFTKRRKRASLSLLQRRPPQTTYPPPTGYYQSTLDWAAAQPSPPWRRDIHGEHTIALKPPSGGDGLPHMAFAIDRFYSPAPYTIVVPDGRVWGEFGAAIAPDNKLLWDVSIFPPFVPDEHPVFRQTRLTPAVFVDETVALLTFCASGMYYHWMFDVLSRFDLLARSGIAVDRFIVNGVRSAFQLETLAALGIPQDKLIHCHADFHLQAKRLVVPVAAAIEWGPHQWQIRYLREELLTRNGIAPSPGWERIYIGRARASHRRVTNEEQVCDVLRVRGFRCIELEDYTVAQQAAILASARFVVAAHGSGLTNLLFCQPGTKVVELFPSNFPVYVYWLLCNHLDLDYYHLFAEGERAADKLDPKHGYDDMFVNPGKLATVLDRIGSGA